MKKEMVEVRYVGKRPMRKDNIADTGTIWFGENDVQEVPANAAILLCAFPTVWQMADKHVIERPVSPAEEDELEAAVAAEAAAGWIPAPEAPDLALSEDEHGFAKPVTGSEVTIEELVVSFSSLDRDNDLTQHNKPKMDVVRAMFEDREVTAVSVKEAWEKFTAVE